MKLKYYDADTMSFDEEGLLHDLERIPDESILLMQLNCHNPTGLDPNVVQWHKIMKAVLKKRHIVFFDSAYQGFGSCADDDSSDECNLDADVEPLKNFARVYDRILLAQSFSKNMGLYGERLGCLSLVCGNKAEKDVV